MILKKIYRGMENGAETIQENFGQLIDMFYPVGSVYQSNKNLNPADFMGGTWTRIKGKVLVGVDENDSDFNISSKIGGEKMHTITVEEMPAHGHQLGLNKGTNPAINGTGTSGFLWGEAIGKTSGLTGDGKAHNNLQPYYTVYTWIRTI